MFCRSISLLSCAFLTVVIASDYSDPDTSTGSDPEVTANSLRTDNPDSPTTEPVADAKETVAGDLGALLDAGAVAMVTLVAGDTRLLAHRAVLAARSPRLATMVRHDTPDASSSPVAVLDVDGPMLRQLVSYIYTLQWPRLPGMDAELQAAAHKYGVPIQTPECEQQAASRLSVETAAATAVLAVRHSCHSLGRAAVSFIRANLLPVMATRGWADAVHNCPKEVVQVGRLLSEPPAEFSALGSGDGWTFTPTTTTSPDYSDYSDPGSGDGWTSTTTSPDYSDPSSGDGWTSTTTSPDYSDPGSGDGWTSTTTSPDYSDPCSGDGWTSTTTSPDYSDPGSGDGWTSTTTSPDYSDYTEAATTALPESPSSTLPPYDVIVSCLRNLTAEEKGRRLIEAAKEGSVWKLRALLDAGADVGAKDESELTALHRAAEAGSVGAVGALLGAGAEVDARSAMLTTPLHFAAFWGHAAAVRQLLAAAADPNAGHLYGRTALHWAAANGHAEAAAALLGAGAAPGAEDAWGAAPLDLARQSRHQQLVDMLS